MQFEAHFAHAHVGLRLQWLDNDGDGNDDDVNDTKQRSLVCWFYSKWIFCRKLASTIIDFVAAIFFCSFITDDDVFLCTQTLSVCAYCARASPAVQRVSLLNSQSTWIDEFEYMFFLSSVGSYLCRGKGKTHCRTCSTNFIDNINT